MRSSVRRCVGLPRCTRVVTAKPTSADNPSAKFKDSPHRPQPFIVSPLLLLVHFYFLSAIVSLRIYPLSDYRKIMFMHST